MILEPLELEGLCLVKPQVYRDARGFFGETWSAARHAAADLDVAFVQDNHSHSLRDSLRGSSSRPRKRAARPALPLREAQC